ncbi:hypothetical protein BKA63DRAFT_525529 [Paraphoma chrysanthemicola]|nr:hypothetical protein BKA63DRAFT_525529 [Paraphoma chrysanthemicola]
MGSRSFAELLLRPSTFTQPLCPTCTITRTARSWTARRGIASTPTPTPTQPSAQPQRKEDDYDLEPRQPDLRQPGAGSPPQEQPPSRFPAPRRASRGDTSQAIDALFSGMPSQRRPPPTATRTQATSSDEMRAARANHVFGSEFSNGSRRSPRGPPRLNFDDMTLPAEMLDPTLSNKPSEAASLATQQEETFANYPRLNPTYGRAVELDAGRGRDLVRGIGMLGSLMARNKVRHDMMKQRFHERGGLKRKRLNSERWRARFKKGFTDVTARVSELTRKGW